MKKISIIVLTMFLSFFFMTIASAKADSLWYDKSRSWDLYNYYSTYYGFRLMEGTNYYITTPESVTAGSIQFPQLTDNISEIGAVDSEIFFNDSEGLVYTETLNNLFGWTSNFGGTIQFVQTEIVTEVTPGVTEITYEVKIIDEITSDIVGSFRNENPITAVGLNIMQNFTSPPSNLFNFWLDNSVITLYTASLRIDCYSYMKRVATIYMAGIAPTAPDDPTPKTGYNFIGWNTITGERFDFSTGYYDPDWITISDGAEVIKLFAIFRADDIAGDDYIPEEQTKPTWLTDVFSLIHFDNSIGYMFVFIVVAVFIVLGMLSNKMTGRAEMIVGVELIWIIIATWLGMIPIYATAILGVIAITLLIKTLSGSGGTQSV